MIKLETRDHTYNILRRMRNITVRRANRLTEIVHKTNNKNNPLTLARAMVWEEVTHMIEVEMGAVQSQPVED